MLIAAYGELVEGWQPATAHAHQLWGRGGLFNRWSLPMTLLWGRGGYNSDDITRVWVGGVLSREAVMTD